MSFQAVLYNKEQECWQRYADPVEIVVAHTLEDVLPALGHLEARVCDGLHAAGFISYEASPAFDEALSTCDTSDFPLMQFGLFSQPDPFELPALEGSLPPLEWQAGITEDEFAKKVEDIREAIARGETYQVNLTFPLNAATNHDPWSFFLHLAHGQTPDCCGFLQSERWAICSASPELFFSRDGERLRMRPMKGTAPRGLTLVEDKRIAEALKVSEKNRAENIMILDMVRNDLGRIAPPGEVNTEAICTLEKHPTVWQLTSTATANSNASLVDIFRSLFPCASITGAPKAKTMQIIAATESTPRDIYTGAFGWIAPDRKAQFSVAIRTAIIDRLKQQATYGVGAGITWDSIGAEEYRECLDKAAVLFTPKEDFALIETLRWTPRHDYFILEEHISRLQASAEYFDFNFDLNKLRSTLYELAEKLPRHPQRVRLLLHRDGRLEASSRPIDEPEGQSIKARFSKEPVNKNKLSLYHKTTQRKLYDHNLAQCNQADEVILWNEQNEVTEGCTTNIVVKKDGKLVTPPVSCGLLPGTYRDYLLKRGIIEEGIILKNELEKSEKVFLINAVRKWRLVELI